MYIFIIWVDSFIPQIVIEHLLHDKFCLNSLMFWNQTILQFASYSGYTNSFTKKLLYILSFLPGDAFSHRADVS